MTGNNNKSNWGKGIAVLYGSFVVFILAIVFFSSRQSFSLVDKNYYRNELEYQEQINRIKNTNALDEKLIWSYKPDEKILSIRFPREHTENGIEGYIHFFKPSDADKDFIIPVDINSCGWQYFSTTKLPEGLWKMKIYWNTASMEFYYEDILIVE